MPLGGCEWGKFTSATRNPERMHSFVWALLRLFIFKISFPNLSLLETQLLYIFLIADYFQRKQFAAEESPALKAL